MSQKSSVPQAVSFVSQVLKRDSEHVTDIVSHYAAPACGTKLGYVDQPSGRYSSAKPGSKNLSTALGAFSAELIFPD